MAVAFLPPSLRHQWVSCSNYMKTKKNRISDAQLKTELMSYFESGNTAITELLGLIRIKYGVGNDRYFPIANQTLNEWKKLKEAAHANTITQNTEQALKMGIKTKNERVIFLQTEIDRMISQLCGSVAFTFIIGDSIKSSKSEDNRLVAPISVQNQLRAMILSYQAEISKIEGDYAPTKTANTNTKGEDVITPFNDAQVQKIIAEMRK